MMSRLEFLRALPRLAWLALAAVAWRGAAAVVAQEVPNLEQTLTIGLRPRLPQDFAFIRKVVKMVDEKRLPLDLVLGTFEWVRDTKKDKKYKMPYFARALKIRAARIGIEV